MVVPKAGKEIASKLSAWLSDGVDVPMRPLRRLLLLPCRLFLYRLCSSARDCKRAPQTNLMLILMASTPMRCTAMRH
jgi:hypothetical protein